MTKSCAICPARSNCPGDSPATGRKQSTNRRVGERRSGNSGVSDSPSDSQGSLELEFLPPAPQAPRTLKTTVEARIYCDAQVAAPMHRSVAAFLDSAMILIGCGIFLGIFQCLGGSVRVDRFDKIVCA